MTSLALAFSGFTSLVLAGFLVRGLLSAPLRSFAVDRPNERSLHVDPVPRTGGVGLLVAALVVWGFSVSAETFPLLLLAVLLAAISLADDVVALSAGTRLAAHVLIAAAVVVVTPAAPAWLIPLVVLTTVWMTNLYNFMDGSDGLAGGMAVFGFGTYAVAAQVSGAQEIAIASAALAGAAGGFLIWNFPKARIFMGDVGSVPLGFLAAALGYAGWLGGAWPFYFPALAFLPFIADATVTLIRRALRGEKLSSPHREHYYQRLNRMGLGHRNTALAGYALMALAAGSALATLAIPAWQAAILIGVWIAGVGVIMARVDQRWRQFEAEAAPTVTSTQAPAP